MNVSTSGQIDLLTRVTKFCSQTDKIQKISDQTIDPLIARAKTYGNLYEYNIGLNIAESNGKLPHLFIPGKTVTLVPEFAVEDLPSAELQPWFLNLQ